MPKIEVVANPIRVMVEAGKKKTVISAFDWPGWDRGAATEEEALAVHAAYRPRYGKVAELAGLSEEFQATGAVKIVERTEGAGMTDFYTLSARTAGPEEKPMSESECERKIALLEACWSYFDEVGATVSPELLKGPRGGGRDRDKIIRHANGAEIVEFAVKVGVKSADEAWQDGDKVLLQAHRKAFSAAIREYNSRGVAARTWALQFLIRRCCYHMLDHAWEMEDKDLSDQA